MFPFLQITFLQKLEQWDQWLFIKLNGVLINPFFDSLMPFLGNGMHWAPLYLFLAVFVIINFKNKGGWWLLFFIVTVALTDMTSTYLFKNIIERLRPCGDPDFYVHVRLLINQCPRDNSFISGYATNHFGIATFFFVSFYPVIKKWAWISFCWAGLTAYAQVYVGEHYPFDVLAGAVTGMITGFITAAFFKKRFGLLQPV